METTKIVENGNMTYYINKEKRTVVCKKTGCEFDIVNLIENISGCYTIPPEMSVKDVLLNSTYTGIAKCNPEDKWDEEKGMEIARKRMLLKYYKDKEKKTETYENLFNEYLNRIQDYANRFSNKVFAMEKEVLEVQ